MKGALKYILLFVVACICSFFIYDIFGPDEEHSIGIELTHQENEKE